MTPDKKEALIAIRDAHLVDNGHWIRIFIHMVISHRDSMNMVELLVLFNQIMQGRLPFIHPHSEEGKWIHQFLSKFVKEANPIQSFRELLTDERIESLENFSRWQPFWTPKLCYMLLTHAEPQKFFTAMITIIQFFRFRNHVLDLVLSFIYHKPHLLNALTLEKLQSIFFAQEKQILDHPIFSPLFIELLLNHRHHQELACALLILNKTPQKIISSFNGHLEIRYSLLKNFLESLMRKEHPFKSVVAYNLMLRSFCYRYTFELEGDAEVFLPYHLYFSQGENGGFYFKLQTTHNTFFYYQLRKNQAPAVWNIENIQAMRADILSEIYEMGLLEVYREEWFIYFMKTFINHPTPFAFALILSKFSDLDFWKDQTLIAFLTHAVSFSTKWLLHPEFLYLFMQLPPSQLTPDLFDELIELTKRIPEGASPKEIIAEVEIFCRRFRKTDLPLNPYISHLYQKEELRKYFPPVHDFFDLPDEGCVERPSINFVVK